MSKAVPISASRRGGNLVFTSGQVALKDGKMVEGNIDEQMYQVMKNLNTVLEGEGVGFEDVVKTTIYVTDMKIYDEVNEIYAEYVSEPYPAREVVCVKALPLGASVEISMVAVKG